MIWEELEEYWQLLDNQSLEQSDETNQTHEFNVTKNESQAEIKMLYHIKFKKTKARARWHLQRRRNMIILVQNSNDDSQMESIIFTEEL
jgi:hypothetical protein